MMRSTILAKAIGLTLWIVQPLAAQDVPAPGSGFDPPADTRLIELTKGRLIRFEDSARNRFEGELLAVNDQSLWLLSSGRTSNISFYGLDEIQVQRHGFGVSKVWTWIGIGAAVTGIGMASACLSVDDSGGECGAVFLGMALSWGVIGGLFSLDVMGSSWAEVRPVSGDLLRYSRFPQGLPAGYDRR